MNNKEYTLGDLSARRPPEHWTDTEWQEYYKVMYSNTQQSSQWTMKKRKCYTTVNGRNIDEQSSYCGDTQYEKYCDFINDMLKTIRQGLVDYCYYIYQVADLLRFEHENLRTEYMQEEECFKVWLEQ